MLNSATDNRNLPAAMSDREFSRFAEFIYDQCGIKMPPVKKTMLEARLQKRLRMLGIGSFQDYADYLFSNDGAGQELVHLIDVVTTNKTDFFREPAHFDYLVSTALPGLAASRGTGFRKGLSLWSAGCSSGEEPYTLAMVLSEFAEHNQGFSYNILASDICTTVLDKAKTAIYLEERVEPVSLPLKRKYLLRGKDKQAGLVRIVPELRNRIRFRRLNFMDDDFGFREPFDIIFCRNVIIYFDKRTQERLINKFCRHLIPGGYLFMGHSETLSGLDVPLVQVASTIYRKPQ
ncbi:CheR family methyltransferase [Geobacter benzoatilyticus]|jgi:chemotaxis protein methyltransferase CheR|uniref:protein-glutamate O-methyltransferase n=1 Tax=Geobacter benzoatilyticus TaxID=2815309 RepID=A0ABX7Q3G6_9BACT|nr:protein-glutamate O-methyltransferase [Geobacter benzoatilyticus]QSV45636.1 protein-glutamate O-methyltransferase [Geobacter benzoatilyticus]